MSDLDHEVFALLDRAAARPVADPPIDRVVAGGRRLRRRRGAQALVGVGIVAAAVIAGAALAGRAPAARTSAPVTAQPLGGPSAQRLAHGHWVSVPAAPVELCNPMAVWDGSALVVFEGPFNKCAPVAAAYDPRSNTWATLAPPPSTVGVEPAAAWGGGRLVLISNKTGAAFAWTPRSDHWQPIADLPATGVSSLTWTGSTFVAITANQTTTAHAYRLGAAGWQSLPDLPPPTTGVISWADGMVDDGAFYAYALVNIHHRNPNDSYVSGHVALWRLSAGRWVAVHLSAGAPKSDVILTGVAGGTIAAGSACPGLCTLEDAELSLLRPGHDPSVIRLRPPRPSSRVPYPYDIAAGAQAVVLTYPDGVDSIGYIALPGSGPAPGTTVIDDLATQTWLAGPTIPGAGRVHSASWGTYWTPYGVLSSRWLLRPAP